MRTAILTSVFFALMIPVAPVLAQNDQINWNKVDIGTMDPAAQTDLFRRSRESFAGDPYRPLYHFSSPGGMIHDPAGMCWWKGKYHMFYQYHGKAWNSAKGHAVSDDLVHWEDLPVAFAMDKDYEIGANFLGTGQVCVAGDQVVINYGSFKRDGGGTCIAMAGDPMLLDWKKHPDNPVISRPSDVSIWYEDGTFYTLLKSSPGPGIQGNVAGEVFRASDPGSWESMGNLMEDGYFTEPGDDLACPNFLPLGNGKALLLFFSHKRSAQFFTGTYDPETLRFHSENHGRMNYGPVKRGSLHAPSAFIDRDGRCIAIWNIIENRPQIGWDEIMSLPRQLSLNEEIPGKDQRRWSIGYLNPLNIEPIEELKSLRFDPVETGELTIPANGEKVLAGVKGKAMELEVVIDPMEAREVGINVLRSPDGREQTTISLYMQGWSRNRNMRDLMIDVSRASLDPKVRSRSPEIGPLYLEDGEPLHLRVFIDRSVVEVFANGRQCLTLRTYPSLEESRGVSVFSRGSEAKLVNLTAWQMRSIWPELKDEEGR